MGRHKPFFLLTTTLVLVGPVVILLLLAKDLNILLEEDTEND